MQKAHNIKHKVKFSSLNVKCEEIYTTIINVYSIILLVCVNIYQCILSIN